MTETIEDVRRKTELLRKQMIEQLRHESEKELLIIMIMDMKEINNRLGRIARNLDHQPMNDYMGRKYK